MKVLNKNGIEIEFNVAVQFMDDEIREALHGNDFADDQEFMTRYEGCHEENLGKEWFLSGLNPVY